MKNNDSLLSNVLYGILSLWSWFFVIFLTLFYNLLGILLFPLSYLIEGRKRRLIHTIAVCWAKSIMLTSPFWRLRVQGAENIESNTHYVVVGNHQSMLDILVALAGIPLHFKFMAKAELFQIPFLGWHMSLAGYIPINRSSVQSGKEALETALAWLDRGVSVLFFPEGTRSLDGEIKKFKAGAFKAASEKNVKILPVVIEGTGNALPKKSFIAKKVARIVVSIQKPVSISKNEDLEDVVEKVRGAMAKHLDGLRRP